MRQKVTYQTICERKAKGEKLARTALYDYPMAVLAEEAGIEIINVGDSMASIIFGYTSLINADLDVMIEHAKAVRRGTPSAFIMGDMPFMSYQVSIQEAIRNAARYLREAGMDCVKVEGGKEIVPVIRALTRAGIPVIGHTGLTPTLSLMQGGYKTQAKTAVKALDLLDTVLEYEKAGAIAVFLEAIPVEVTKMVYERLSIPLMSVGCGPYSDAPSINWYEIMGFFEKSPKFAKRYARARELFLEAARSYISDVYSGDYPRDEHCYHMMPGESEILNELVKQRECEKQP